MRIPKKIICGRMIYLWDSLKEIKISKPITAAKKERAMKNKVGRS
jgi:hypothetical protein